MLAFSSPASPSPYAHGSLHRLVGRVLHGTGCREGAEGQESCEGSEGQRAVFGGLGRCRLPSIGHCHAVGRTPCATRWPFGSCCHVWI